MKQARKNGWVILSLICSGIAALWLFEWRASRRDQREAILMGSSAMSEGKRKLTAEGVHVRSVLNDLQMENKRLARQQHKTSGSNFLLPPEIELGDLPDLPRVPDGLGPFSFQESTDAEETYGIALSEPAIAHTSPVDHGGRSLSVAEETVRKLLALHRPARASDN